MPISEGDKLPEATVMTMTSEGPTPMTISALTSGQKVVIFAVPGAFTPTCHVQHLPGFIANAEAIKAKGVDTIACISVNDVHVMDAWAKASGADNSIKFLADGSAEFTKAIGMELDLTAVSMGVRSQRYAMIVDDGRVTSLHIETKRGAVVDSGAEAILAAL
jgi:peroxiredoxin